jgi:prepilin peptidase CpaA
MSLSPIAAAVSTASLAVLVIAAFIDVRDRLIPDHLVVLTFGGGLVVRLVADPDLTWLSLGISLGIAFGVFVVLAYVTRHRFIGGGDAKMIAAVTMLVPPAGVIPLLLDIALAGGVIALVYLVARLGLTRRPTALAYAAYPVGGDSWLCSMVRTEVARIVGGEPMPYGLAIAAGVAYRLLLEVVR